jgi:hypothetical protein
MELKTYIKNPQHKKNNLPEFIELTEIEKIRQLKTDAQYVEGAIILNCYGREILGFEDYDYILPMWEFWVSAIEEYLSAGKSVVNFPDQPRKIRLERVGKDMLKIDFSDENVKNIAVNESDFIRLISNGASFFFSEFQNLFGVNTKSMYNE